MTVSCSNLLGKLGYKCLPIVDGTICVTTPFTFVDGEPIGFYLADTGGSVYLSDNSDTLAHFAGIGWDIGDRKKWKAIKNIASSFDLELLDSGEIVGRAEANMEFLLLRQYVCAMLAVVDLERDYWGLTEEQNQYVQEVEMALRSSNPKATLASYPLVEGHSGKKHQFHFLFDGKLVDAARPHGAKTGSILRKTLDIRNAGNQTDILVVMDDRDDPERALAETDILSTSVSVIQYSRLLNRPANSESSLH